jgi:hypothetical protein
MASQGDVVESRLRVATPRPRDGVERPPQIPESVLRARESSVTPPSPNVFFFFFFGLFF